jgi:long-chain acyl-CoA synthetase
MSHSFGKVLMAGHIASGSVTAVDGRIPKLVDNLAVVKPTIMAAVPRIFEKVYNRIIEGAKQGSPMKQRIFQWAVETGKQGSQVRQQGREPSGLLAWKLKLADRLVFSKIKERFGGRVRYFISGSAPLSRDIAEFFHACGVLILEGYGLTETSAAAFVNRPESFSFGTVGIALPGTEVKIASDDGEILIRSPGVMNGYHNLPDQTAEALTGDGWLRTGDVGEIDEEGFLRITDRKKDLIITAGGKNIAPQNLENAIKASRFVSQAIVVGDRRPYVTALVTLDEAELASSGRDPQELVQEIVDEVNRDRTRVEQIKRFVILPRDFSQEEGEVTPTLKLRRRVIHEHFADEIEQLYAGEPG